MEKVLVLDNYDSFTYNLVHYIEAILGDDVAVFRNNEITIAQVADYSTIILSPGPGLPKDAGILLELIKEYAPTKKILGVCLGMQAIAEAFGGGLENLNQVFHGIATKINVLDKNDKLFLNLPSQFNVGRYHSWVVSKNQFPSSLIITSVDDDNQIMSVRHKNYNVYGVQFHPESILSEHGKKILTNFLMG